MQKEPVKDVFPFEAALRYGKRPVEGQAFANVLSSPNSPLRYRMGEKLYSEHLERIRREADANRKSSRRLVELAQRELWVREETGNNDGIRVEGYLVSVGLEKGQPWCAAFVSFIFKQAGYSAPRTGWSPSLFPLRRIVNAAAPGDVFGIYFPALQRIAHCGLVERLDGDWITGIEGNTSVGGGRDGDGVHRRKRHKRTIYQYADWK